MDCLFVAGNERLSNGQQNTWNIEKSTMLLKFYGDIDAGSDSESENESSERAKAKRLRVARRIGITVPQINFASFVV